MLHSKKGDASASLFFERVWSRVSAFQPDDQPPPQQRNHDRAIGLRQDQIVLARSHPPEMQDRECRDQVDRLVQRLPPAAEFLHHRFRRRHRERNQQQERGEANRDERPLDDVLQNRGDVEPFVEPQVRREMQHGVEERVKPEHPPKSQQRIHAGQPPRRRNRKRDAEVDERPEARRARDEFDRVRARARR